MGEADESNTGKTGKLRHSRNPRVNYRLRTSFSAITVAQTEILTGQLGLLGSGVAPGLFLVAPNSVVARCWETPDAIEQAGWPPAGWLF